MIPVTVRLANSNTDRHITNILADDPSWRSAAPGGFGTAAFALQKPIDVRDPMLAAFTKVYIYDGRTAETLWEGRLQLPARSADADGQVWSLTALGGASHTSDETRVLIYIDRSHDGWVRDNLEASRIPANATAGSSNHPFNDGLDALVVSLPSGVQLNTNTEAMVSYQECAGLQSLGAWGYSYSFGGGGSTNFALEGVTGDNPTFNSIDHSVLLPGVGGSFSTFAHTSPSGANEFPAGQDILGLRLRRTTGGATPGADNLWIAFYDVRVLCRRYMRNGFMGVGSSGMNNSSLYVRASWIVEDLLGRLLRNVYDADGASVDATNTVDIDQLAYRDGATAADVLDDLMKIEPSKYWAAWESEWSLTHPGNGGYRFEWKTWPTTARYEATVDDGFDATAASAELYNSWTIRWRDNRGRIKITRVTAAVPELDSNNLTRGGFTDLSDEIGSATNATAVATNTLAEHNRQTSSARLTIARPIMDVQNNRVVWPWQIRPGEEIRLRGVEASATTNVTQTTRDGMTVFRIVSVEVNKGVAQLELDMFTQNEIRALIELRKMRRRRR